MCRTEMVASLKVLWRNGPMRGENGLKLSIALHTSSLGVPTVPVQLLVVMIRCGTVFTNFSSNS